MPITIRTGLLLDAFPGQPANRVGFAAAPGYAGSLTTWPGGGFTGGSVGNPTIVSGFDFPLPGGVPNINVSNITFIGCRFQSSAVAGNNVSIVNAQNVVFSYCSFTPDSTLYAFPPGQSWPSAGAGAQTNVFTAGFNCINGNSGYQFGLTFTNAADGPVTMDHCDIWGFGNAVNFIATTAQQTLTDCWIHDAADAGPQSYHTDGPGYLNGGTPPQNIRINHCTIATIGTTNALAFQAATSAYVNIVVTRNFFSGFNVCVDMCHDVAASTGLVFTDNIIGTDLPWTNGPLSGSSMFITNGSPVNVWRRNKFRVLPRTSTIAGQQFSWTAADDNKFILPDGTLSTTDYTG